LIIAALALPLMAYLWAARDVLPDSRSASSIVSIPVRPRLAGFKELTALAERIGDAKIEASRRLPANYDEDRQAVDELLDADLAKDLPRAVEETLASAKAGATNTNVSPAAALPTWSSAYTTVRLLTLQMERQWARKDDGAWHTGQLELRFVRFLLSQTRSFNELTSAEASCVVAFRALASAIDAGRLTREQLHELTGLSVPSDLVDRLRDATRNEYAVFEGQLDQVRGQNAGPLSRVFFHPNRTRQAWLASMAELARPPQLEDLEAAQQALSTTATHLSNHQPLVRNSVGSSLLAMSLPGNAEAMAQLIDLVADFRLLAVRATLAIYRIDRGSLPADLVELRASNQAEIPLDPWSRHDFRFSKSDGRIYSVGRDRQDDQGRFTRDLSQGGAELDLGLRFSKE